jgi:hypothetical protein
VKLTPGGGQSSSREGAGLGVLDVNCKGTRSMNRVQGVKIQGFGWSRV